MPRIVVFCLAGQSVGFLYTLRAPGFSHSRAINSRPCLVILPLCPS
jgi:hypothetical protein